MEDRNLRQLTHAANWRNERFFPVAPRDLWLGVGLLMLFVLFAFTVPAKPLAIDRAWSELMKDIQSPVLKVVALVFNYAGRGVVRALSLTVIGVVLLLTRRTAGLLAFAIAEAFTPLVSSVTKLLVDRERPPGGLVHASGTSFPSGHAAYAGITCVALVLLFTDRSRRWWCLALAGIAGMAWSRTYLQVHWLSDVIAGSILGVAVALVVFGCFQMRLRVPFEQVKGP